MTGSATPSPSRTPQRIALFGGSFNPIHHGHLIVARAVAEHLHVSKLVLVPSATPPHKQASPDLADARARFEMVKMAIAEEPDFEVNDLEIHRSGPSYTYDTVCHYRTQIEADATLYWVIGGDTLPELHTWYRARELADACTIVTAVRPGFETPDLAVLRPTLSLDQLSRLMENVLPTPRIDISATEIRRRVRAGKSIRYLVPETVRTFINASGLYRV